jgi:hypothetical protein
LTLINRRRCGAALEQDIDRLPRRADRERSIFCPRRKRQTCCSCTSPNSAAISDPVHRANPAGGGRSNTARMRRPVSAVSRLRARMGLVAEPGQPLAREPAAPEAYCPRHRRNCSAMDRVGRPSAASKMIRARNASRCSVVGARTRASSTARSSDESRASVALGIIPMLNHESACRKSGY